MRRNSNGLEALLLCAAILAVSVWGIAAASSARQDPQRPDSYDSSAPGAPPAPNAPAPSTSASSDRLMAQKIRSAIAAANNFSAGARKVQVSVRGGKATLQGTVASLAERSALVTKATDVAGAGNVINKLKISTASE
jgi:osmotically-inducible protein OsmY